MTEKNQIITDLMDIIIKETAPHPQEGSEELYRLASRIYQYMENK